MKILFTILTLIISFSAAFGQEAGFTVSYRAERGADAYRYVLDSKADKPVNSDRAARLKTHFLSKEGFQEVVVDLERQALTVYVEPDMPEKDVLSVFKHEGLGLQYKDVVYTEPR